MVNLEDAISLAVHLHRGAVDLAGQPYILHPLRVMVSLKTENEKIVGVLHDVLDRSGISLEDLARMGYSSEVVTALDVLCRREGESYRDYILRVKNDALARKVKLADLEDNMDVSRLTEVSPEDQARLEKYRKARTDLLGATDMAEAVQKTIRQYFEWGGVPFVFDRETWSLFRIAGRHRQEEITDADSFAMIRRNSEPISEEQAMTLAAELDEARGR